MAETFLQALGASYNFDLGSAGWKPGVDRNFVLLDTFSMGHVISDAVSAEPGSPNVGDAYILPAGLSGANWATDAGAVENAVAVYTNITTGQADDSPWYYITPKEGWLVYNRALNTWRLFTGSAWVDGEVVTFELSPPGLDLVTNISAGTDAMYMRAPRAFRVSAVRASLLTAGTTGSQFDINRNGTTMLSTKLTIDANENSSQTAAAPPVIDGAEAVVADDDLLTVDIDTAGTGAQGLIVTLIGGVRR